MGLLIGSGALSRCTAPIWGECVYYLYMVYVRFSETSTKVGSRQS